MEPVEVKFLRGQLRQPGLWGKVLKPEGAIVEYDNPIANPGVELVVEKSIHKIVLPNMADGTYLVWGIKGFWAASALSQGFVLMKVQQGQFCECAFSQHLARFEAKNALLQTQSETDLQPIYKALEEAKYGHLQRLQDFLKRENKDKPAAK